MFFSEHNNRLKKKRAANFEVHICGIHWCTKSLLALLNTVLVSNSNKLQGLFSIFSRHCQMKVDKDPPFFLLMCGRLSVIFFFMCLTLFQLN